jgi:3-dehydroquinate synthase
MRIIKVNLGKRTYPIIVGNAVLKTLPRILRRLRLGNSAYIITNAAIKNKYGALLEKTLKEARLGARFKTVAEGEKSKSIETAAGVIRGLARYDKKRRVFIIAFGGGVIGDLSGFVASVYKRGIPYIQIPTTLLAQVDSAIGGKTAVDLAEGKNLIGAFYQPRLVLSEVNFLRSLDKKQITAGLAEVIKYGVIKDRALFNYVEKNYKKILGKNSAALEYIVSASSRIKAKIVSSDEREEKGIRTILNFGHTAGHAIEAAAGFKKYNHGQAIALGMLVALEISKSLGLIDQRACLRIERLIKKSGLPAKIGRVNLGRIINAHFRDKKFIGRKNRLVLACAIGRVKVAENIPLALIKAAIKKKL